jgi:hypothetical protein
MTGLRNSMLYREKGFQVDRGIPGNTGAFPAAIKLYLMTGNRRNHYFN